MVSASFKGEGSGGRMSNPGKIEYRVRPIIRWQVTMYEESADRRAAWVKQKGEYDSAGMAYEVGYALCREDHQRMGWPVGDERIQYPNNPMVLTKEDMEDELKATSAHYQGLHHPFSPGIEAPRGSEHASDCALHNEPAMPNEPCNCGAT